MTFGTQKFEDSFFTDRRVRDFENSLLPRIASASQRLLLKAAKGSIAGYDRTFIAMSTQRVENPGMIRRASVGPSGNIERIIQFGSRAKTWQGV